MGGRPPKRKHHEIEDGLPAPANALSQALGQGNRKLHSVKGQKDETFGINARLEVCTMVERLLPIFERISLSLNDVYVYVADQTGRPKARIEWAHSGKAKWLKGQARLELGKGTKSSTKVKGQPW